MSKRTLVKRSKLSQAGWTTMEYVVGAIALVSVVTMVIGVFGDKLTAAIQGLTLPH